MYIYVHIMYMIYIYGSDVFIFMRSNSDGEISLGVAETRFEAIDLDRAYESVWQLRPLAKIQVKQYSCFWSLNKSCGDYVREGRGKGRCKRFLDARTE